MAKADMAKCLGVAEGLHANFKASKDWSKLRRETVLQDFDALIAELQKGASAQVNRVQKRAAGAA